MQIDPIKRITLSLQLFPYYNLNLSGEISEKGNVINYRILLQISLWSYRFETFQIKYSKMQD